MEKFDNIDLFFIAIITGYFITLGCIILTFIIMGIKNIVIKIKSKKAAKLSPIIEVKVEPAIVEEEVKKATKEKKPKKEKTKEIIPRKPRHKLSELAIVQKLFMKKVTQDVTNIEINIDEEKASKEHTTNKPLEPIKLGLVKIIAKKSKDKKVEQIETKLPDLQEKNVKVSEAKTEVKANKVTDINKDNKDKNVEKVSKTKTTKTSKNDTDNKEKNKTETKEATKQTTTTTKTKQATASKNNETKTEETKTTNKTSKKNTTSSNSKNNSKKTSNNKTNNKSKSNSSKKNNHSNTKKRKKNSSTKKKTTTSPKKKTNKKKTVKRKKS